jgi:hypothetical protein
MPASRIERKLFASPAGRVPACKEGVMLNVPVRTRVLKNGSNGWYWEVVAEDREVLERGVTNSLDAARAQADLARQLAARELKAASIPPWLKS